MWAAKGQIVNTKEAKEIIDSLRVQAEARIAEDSTILPPQSIDKLLTELQVYQVELEMQNESLRQTQFAMEQARDRYANLYDFAPVGYLTINTDGLIGEVNLKATKMLGVERNKMINRPFAKYVAAPDQDRWYLRFMQMKRLDHGAEQDVELHLKCEGGLTIHAHINCQQTIDEEGSQSIRIALTDISKQKQVDDGLRIAAENILVVAKVDAEKKLVAERSKANAMIELAKIEAEGLVDVERRKAEKMVNHARDNAAIMLAVARDKAEKNIKEARIEAEQVLVVERRKSHQATMVATYH